MPFPASPVAPGRPPAFGSHLLGDPVARRVAAERARYDDPLARRLREEQARWAGREEPAARRAREEFARAAGLDEPAVRAAMAERARMFPPPGDRRSAG